MLCTQQRSLNWRQHFHVSKWISRFGFRLVGHFRLWLLGRGLVRHHRLWLGAQALDAQIDAVLANLADQPEPPILRDGDRSSGYYWSWVRSHPLMTQAHRESAMVETLLLRRMAHHLLPPSLAKQLADEERLARVELVKNPNSDVAWWLDRVMALPPGPQRFPLQINDLQIVPGSR